MRTEEKQHAWKAVHLTRPSIFLVFLEKLLNKISDVRLSTHNFSIHFMSFKSFQAVESRLLAHISMLLVITILLWMVFHFFPCRPFMVWGRLCVYISSPWSFARQIDRTLTYSGCNRLQ